MTETAPDFTGIWLSTYRYESTSRGPCTSSHYVRITQDGARLTGQSVPASASNLVLDLRVEGPAVIGTWREDTNPDGPYAGAAYFGTLMMIPDPSGHRLAGKWAGNNKEGGVETGDWTFTLIDPSADESAVERWNREPE